MVVALTALLVAPLAVTAPSPAQADDAQVAEWQRFRQSFSLRHDRAFVEWAAARAAEAGPEISLAYGTPLTQAEASLIDNRAAQSRAQAAAIRRYFGSRGPELSGGIYFDHHRGGSMVVLVTEQVNAVARDIRALGVYPDRTVVVPARYSAAYLRRLQDEVAAMTASLERRGVEVVSTTHRVEENVVEIRVRSDVATAKSELAAHFPADAVRVEPGDYLVREGTEVKNSPPFRGGQRIGDATRPLCSIGFIGHDGAGSHFAITAGHCGSAGSAWYQPCCAGTGAGVGVMDYNPYLTNNAIIDAARIPIVSSRKSNQITRTMPDGGIYYYAITSSEAQGADTVGDPNCNGGATTNWSCGKITATSYDYKDDGVGRWFYYARKSTARSASGDSGGPHFLVPVAHGIHQGRDRNYIEDVSDDESVYSHIYDVLDELYLLDIYPG